VDGMKAWQGHAGCERWIPRGPVQKPDRVLAAITETLAKLIQATGLDYDDWPSDIACGPTPSTAVSALSHARNPPGGLPSQRLDDTPQGYIIDGAYALRSVLAWRLLNT
jgi:hypothetical protein